VIVTIIIIRIIIITVYIHSLFTVSQLCSAYPALVQTLCEIFGIVYPPGGLDSDGDSPSSIAERARVVKGGIEGVLNRKNTDAVAVISRESDVSVCDSDVHDVVTQPWIGSDEQGMEGEGLVVADLIAVGIISRLDAGPADSHSGNGSGHGQCDENDLPDIPCAADVEYIGVNTTDAVDVGASDGELTDIESYAYQLAEEEDAVAEAEVVEVDVVDVEVLEVEVEGVCVGSLLAQDDDGTAEVGAGAGGSRSNQHSVARRVRYELEQAHSRVRDILRSHAQGWLLLRAQGEMRLFFHRNYCTPTLDLTGSCIIHLLTQTSFFHFHPFIFPPVYFKNQ
jgi:hypothetical protein